MRAQTFGSVPVYIYISELAHNLTATASVVQSIERRSRVKFAAGGLEVAFFATGPV